jgi:type II secretory pathway component PulF
MSTFPRYITLFAATTFTLLATLGGCAQIGAAIDCDQMCEQLQTCIDGDLDVHRCADRCEDKAESNKLRKQLDECTDCLDQGYACAEMSQQCPACEGVTDALL